MDRKTPPKQSSPPRVQVKKENEEEIKVRFNFKYFYDIDAEFPLEYHHLVTVLCYWQAACFGPSRNRRQRNRIFKFDIVHVD